MCSWKYAFTTCFIKYSVVLDNQVNLQNDINKKYKNVFCGAIAIVKTLL